jgi:heme oxygenase
MDREELEANKDIVKDNNIIDDKDFKDKLEKDVNYLNKSNVNENVIDTTNKNNIIDKEIEP